MTKSATDYIHASGLSSMQIAGMTTMNLTVDEWVATLPSFVPCGKPYAGVVSGEPVSCTLVEDHVQERHYNHELKVDWY
jgi:hypothetical protein